MSNRHFLVFILLSSYFPSPERPLIATVLGCFFLKEQRSTGARRGDSIIGEVKLQEYDLNSRDMKNKFQCLDSCEGLRQRA